MNSRGGLKSWLAAIATASLAMAPLSSVSPALAEMTPSMSVGSSGPSVKELQSRLSLLGYYHGKLDGSFGWDTYWAVRDFQYAFGMPVTGNVQTNTIDMLTRATATWTPLRSTASSGASAAAQPSSTTAATTGQTAAAQPSSATAATTGQTAAGQTVTGQTTNGIAQNDITLMAHIVYGEARGQPFIGQVAVAAVILNRYHSSKFPHSISGIIYQPGAFTSLTNGQANGINNSAVQAVMDAIHGWDPTHGALYYWNPATSTSTWIWSQPIMLQIGNHVFAK